MSSADHPFRVPPYSHGLCDLCNITLVVSKDIIVREYSRVSIVAMQINPDTSDVVRTLVPIINNFLEPSAEANKAA